MSERLPDDIIVRRGQRKTLSKNADSDVGVFYAFHSNNSFSPSKLQPDRDRSWPLSLAGLPGIAFARSTTGLRLNNSSEALLLYYRINNNDDEDFT